VEGGWNITGNSFVRDAEGYFHFAARNDDMSVNAGCSIAGLAFLAALLSHDATDECAVICALDEARLAIVAAPLVLTEGVSPDATLAKTLPGHVKATIAFFKYPRSVVIW
jgi:2-aminobenzoate-CoA ligase